MMKRILCLNDKLLDFTLFRFFPKNIAYLYIMYDLGVVFFNEKNKQAKIRGKKLFTP
jgi:hypothetical protein